MIIQTFLRQIWVSFFAFESFAQIMNPPPQNPPMDPDFDVIWGFGRWFLIWKPNLSHFGEC